MCGGAGVCVSEHKLVLWATKIFLFGKGIFHNKTTDLVYWILASDLIYSGTNGANGVNQTMRAFPTE